MREKTLLLGLLLICAGCASLRTGKPFDPPLDRYTRANVRHLPGNLVTWENWQSTVLMIPPGTKVTIPDTKFFVVDATGARYQTNFLGNPAVLDKFFAAEPPDVSASDETRAAIERGAPKVGMTKAEIFMALGPPTLTLDPVTGTWLWSNRTNLNQMMASDYWSWVRRKFSKKLGVYFDKQGVAYRVEGAFSQQ